MSLRGIILFSLLFIWAEVVPQNAVKADSLKNVYRSNEDSGQDPFLLNEIAKEVRNPDTILKYSNLAIEASKASSNKAILQKAYQSRGVGWRYKANYIKALKDLFTSLKLAEELNKMEAIGVVYIEIGNVYSENNNNELAETYYSRGLDILREGENEHMFGKGLFNLADEMLKKGMIDSSLVYTEEAQLIFEKHGDSLGKAYSLGNIGMIYAQKGDDRRAEKNLKEAIDLLEKVPDYSAITVYLSTMADIYMNRGDERTAINYAERSLEAAETYGLRGNLEEIHYKLSNIYERVGNTAESYDHFKQYVLYKDSIQNIQSVEEMANLRTDFELARKQTEVDLLNQQKSNQRNIVIATVIALLLIMLLALGLYRRNRYIGRTKKIIEQEKNRSDNLLLNILPQETAMELKEKGKVSAKRFDAVTILFTDFRNFTHYAENLSPEELVKTVDFYFSKFDEIVERHGLEKIKTVGDAYMCAAGVPFPIEDHAYRILLVACDMLSFVKQAREQNPKGETRFDIRIGVNSGPVVAGVVGRKKWAYDIWGDAVNIAARMETSSELGKINISENTYELVKDRFDCHYRGEIMVKNKGMMKMYFIKKKKSMSQSNVA